MEIKKLNDVSLSGIIANKATFFSPILVISNSSVCVNLDKDSRLNFSKRAANVI